MIDPAWKPTRGKAVALPSVRISGAEEAEVAKKRLTGGTQYGGAGDKGHLGGFTDFDENGVSPTLWSAMMKDLTVKSFLDIGCGRGISTTYFLTHGADVLCAEGSHDAVEHSLLPKERIVEHDFTRGPWWPEKTYDVVWSVEFLEHVARPYMRNYMTAFHKAALIFCTHSIWGGWHHVEVHKTDWWVERMERHGFVYSKRLTEWTRSQATKGKDDKTPVEGKTFTAQHLWTQMMVFINPAVARLPQHDHLLGEPGCWYTPAVKDCVGEDKLTPQYDALSGAASEAENAANDIKWKTLIWPEQMAAQQGSSAPSTVVQQGSSDTAVNKAAGGPMIAGGR